jgi:hypothetical protein
MVNPDTFLADLRASLGVHEATCEHCHSFARQVVDGDFGRPSRTTKACPACDRGAGLAVADGSTERCAACGFPLLPGHRLEIIWAEVPGWGVHQGWGGSDVWVCSCGWNEGEEEDAALAHARAHPGATIAVVPDFLAHTARFSRGFPTERIMLLPVRPFRTFHRKGEQP